MDVRIVKWEGRNEDIFHVIMYCVVRNNIPIMGALQFSGWVSYYLV